MRNLLKILHDRFACLCLLVHSFRVVRARVYVPLENSFSFVFWGFYEYLENTQNVTSTEWTNVQTWCMIFACLSVIWMTSKTPNFSIAWLALILSRQRIYGSCNAKLHCNCGLFHEWTWKRFSKLIGLSLQAYGLTMSVSFHHFVFILLFVFIFKHLLHFILNNIFDKRIHQT